MKKIVQGIGLVLTVYFTLAVSLVQAGETLSGEEYLAAAREGNLSTMIHYLDQGGKVDFQDDQGTTALMIAAESGNIAMAQMLIERGADLDENDNHDWTPLCFAARGDQVEIAKILIAEQTEINTVSLWKPLRIACEQNQEEVIRAILLLHRWVKVYHDDHGGVPLWKMSIARNELLSAVGRGDLQTVKKLLPAPNRYDAVLLKQAIELAEQEGLIELQEYFQDKIQSQITNAQDQEILDTTLRKAVEDGDYEKVSAMLYKGANVLSCDKIAKWNALQIAARSGHLAILEKLLENDEDHKLFSQFAESMLCNAAEEKKIDMVRYLSGRIGPSKKGIYDYPLIRLVEAGDVDIMKFIIHQGGDVNAIPKWCSDTPLIRAAKGGKAKVVEFLIQQGADVKARDEKGFTALDHARNEGNDDVAQILTQAGGQSTTSIRSMKSPLFTYEVLNDHDRLRKLFSHGIDLKVKDDYGWTPLLYAMNYGHPDVAKIMIEYGADVNDPGNMMNTCPPLVMATEISHVELVKLLVDKGADVNAIRIYDGRTALIIAASKNNLVIVKYLLAHGARTDIKDRRSKTAEDLARESGYTDIVNIIKKK